MDRQNDCKIWLNFDLRTFKTIKDEVLLTSFYSFKLKNALVDNKINFQFIITVKNKNETV